MLCSQSLVCWQPGRAGEWGALHSHSCVPSVLVPSFGVSLLCSLSVLLWLLALRLCWECSVRGFSLGQSLSSIPCCHCSSPFPNFLLLKQVGPAVSCVMLNSHSRKTALSLPADATLLVCLALRPNAIDKALGEM